MKPKLAPPKLSHVALLFNTSSQLRDQKKRFCVFSFKVVLALVSSLAVMIRGVIHSSVRSYFLFVSAAYVRV